MAETAAGQVVYCLSGREKGHFMVVLSINNGYAMLSDGRERPIERPKLKNPKHFTLTNAVLSEEEISTNRRIKQQLKRFNKEVF